jgi:hypothetical protein
VLWSTISLPRRVPQLAGTDMRPPPLRERPGPERPQPIFIGTLNGCRWALPCPALRQVILPPRVVENLFDGIPVGVRPAFATGLLSELVPDLQCQPHRLPKPPLPCMWAARYVKRRQKGSTEALLELQANRRWARPVKGGKTPHIEVIHGTIGHM